MTLSFRVVLGTYVYNIPFMQLSILSVYTRVSLDPIFWDAALHPMTSDGFNDFLDVIR